MDFACDYCTTGLRHVNDEENYICVICLEIENSKPNHFIKCETKRAKSIRLRNIKRMNLLLKELDSNETVRIYPDVDI